MKTKLTAIFATALLTATAFALATGEVLAFGAGGGGGI
jgi:hypothetical protein